MMEKIWHQKPEASHPKFYQDNVRYENYLFYSLNSCPLKFKEETKQHEYLVPVSKIVRAKAFQFLS